MQKSCTVNKQNFKIIIENDLLNIQGSNLSYQFHINLYLLIDWMVDFSGFTIHTIHVRLSQDSGQSIFNLLAARVMNCNYQRFFENLNLIDKGQSMGFYDSIRLFDNQWFATKTLMKNNAIPLEIKLLKSFSQIIRPRYFFMDDNNYYIVFEKLYNLEKPKDQIQFQKQFKQILKTLEYIYEQGCIHRDIKTKNHRQNINQQVQLIGLGLVIKQYNTQLKQSGNVGYIAHEIFKGPYQNQKADIFSLGAVFYGLQAKIQLLFFYIRQFGKQLTTQHNVGLRNFFFRLKIILSYNLVIQPQISYQIIQLKTLISPNMIMKLDCNQLIASNIVIYFRMGFLNIHEF